MSIALGNGGTADSLEVIRSSAAAIHVHVDQMDKHQTDATVLPRVFPTNNQFAAAATSKITTDPVASHEADVVGISIRNTDASLACDITVQHKIAGASITQLIKVTLQPGELLLYAENGAWGYYAANGGLIAGGSAASTTVAGFTEHADQGEMEAAVDLTRSVPPGNMHFHPAMVKFWARVTVSAGTPTLSTSYNVTSITDTATGRLTVTINVDFSSVNWCCQVSVEAASNATAVANRRIPCVANAGLAAGTVEVNCWDQTATNSALVDPATWFVLGLGDL